MISYSEIKKGAEIIFQKEPHQVLEADLMFKGRGHSTLQVRLRNLVSGNIVLKTFRPSDNFEEAEISKISAEFIYSNKNVYFFCKKVKPSERFSLNKIQIGEKADFLKPKETIEALIFQDKVINISMPIKTHLKVESSPPGIKAGRAEAGTKQVILETGIKINAPLFIKEGDVIEINTETKEYIKRVKQ